MRNITRTNEETRDAIHWLMYRFECQIPALFPGPSPALKMMRFARESSTQMHLQALALDRRKYIES